MKLPIKKIVVDNKNKKPYDNFLLKIGDAANESILLKAPDFLGKLNSCHLRAKTLTQRLKREHHAFTNNYKKYQPIFIQHTLL